MDTLWLIGTVDFLDKEISNFSHCNIVEAFKRKDDKDYGRFLNIGKFTGRNEILQKA